MPQTLGAYVDATTLEGAKQTIAVGPVASQVAIKMLGTNGGGFFNANAAHPFENPTALSNFLQIVSIFALGAALTNVFGRMVGDQRQGWAILAAMGVLFIAGVTVAYWAEAAGNPQFASLGLDPANMEGKEVRFGVALSALFAVITTAASCGAVNAMHDSFTPLGGMIPLINMELGEVIVGGVGAGLYGMLIFVVITIFVAGLMVGRTPEYVGKKIEAKEVKMAMLAILVLPLMFLGWTAVATVLLRQLSGRAAGKLGFDPEDAAKQIVKREELGSTGVGNGVALPHARLAGLKAPFGVLVRLAQAIDFEAIDDEPVDLVFLLLLPEAAEGAQLNALACAARAFRDPKILREMRRANDGHPLFRALANSGTA